MGGPKGSLFRDNRLPENSQRAILLFSRGPTISLCSDNRLPENRKSKMSVKVEGGEVQPRGRPLERPKSCDFYHEFDIKS